MIYDCFQFFNELDILKLRLHVLSDVVDKFVISEATETFSGLPKPLYYEENKEMFREFSDRIIHVVVTDTPKGYTHDRDTFQKNAVGRGLVGAKPDDIILFSDLDEIPNPDKIREILPNFQDDKIYHFAQRMFYCYLNMEEVSGNLLSYGGEFPGVSKKQWLGTRMCRYGLLQERGMQLGDLRFPECKEIGIRVADGGWHFGYMGGHGEKDVKKRVEEKVVSAAHEEYNNRHTLSRVEDQILDGKDIFGRDAKFVRVPIDETYPRYLREHEKEYDYLILKEEAPAKRALRHARERAEDALFQASLPARRMARRIVKRDGSE